MIKAFLLLTMLILSGCCFSQVSDMISVQKKNGQIIKNFMVGQPIELITTYNNTVEGYIDIIRDDSIFITTYDIGYIPTTYNVPMLDTLGAYGSVIAFSEISKIRIHKRQGFSRGLLPKLLMLGGAGYLVLNLINANKTNEGLSDPSTINTLLISAGVFATGLILDKTLADGRYSLKKHQIKYIRIR
ncbi:MAG: hypothetical protein J7497_05645 [Chitinophagaceae bacterium]|nr:hypothetical protein [Chitinophagaceae bacterium]